ncbi:MAG: hypothetical protein ACM358_15750, partial [Gemmatimonadota bacterium]
MLRRFLLLAIALAPLGGALTAQTGGPSADSSVLTVDRIFGSAEFRSGSFGPLAWLSDGTGYTTLERAVGRRSGGGRDIVRYDVETGARVILVPAARLVP